ncbi:MAG: CDP-archaeol synthase [Chromatiaceae bacterium]|nr:CDP-archaeol synthase [Gammaproteobacteria bacterium]MCP5300947.1 CDP-archaeol synthase [Chromatiaceae bacterium]MCP5421580.1 CDP-archaeol synthase [Chromatiaceae bacterium]
MHELAILLLLLAANGSPLLARIMMRGRWDAPLDGGTRLADGHPLFGTSKTWRGVVTAVAVSAALAAMTGFGWDTGACIGVLAMTGDLASSFAKRRLGLASGHGAVGLDQLPESLLPLWVCRESLDLSALNVVWLGLGFAAADLLLSRLMYRLGLRIHPH